MKATDATPTDAEAVDIFLQSYRCPFCNWETEGPPPAAQESAPAPVFCEKCDVPCLLVLQELA